MRIFYLTPSFQHPAMRGPTRCYYFAKALGRRHELTLLAQSREPVVPEAMEEMEACCDRVLVVRSGSPDPAGSLLAGIPRIGRRLAEIRAERRAVARLGEVMAEELQRGAYDVVLFHGKSIAGALEGLEGVPLVVDFCDATSLRVRSRMQHARPAKAALLFLRWLETRRVERRLLRRTPHHAFISVRDRDAILGPGASAAVVPIGVDTGHFTRRAPPADTPTIVFTGVLSYHPNADAALFLVDEVLPRLRRAIPGVRVKIVGRDPAPALRERAERDPAVTVTGFVPDLRPHLEAAAVAVAPVRYGAGVQNKVLEAMAMELPVVATSFVAGGLRAPGGEEAPLAVGDGPDGFADQVAYLLRNPQAARDLGLRGRRFVEEHHVWARSAEILEMLCKDAVKARER